jgi:hypothetical protein
MTRILYFIYDDKTVGIELFFIPDRKRPINHIFRSGCVTVMLSDHEQTIIDGGSVARVDWATARKRAERRAVLWQTLSGSVVILLLAAEARGRRCADVHGVDACG